MYWENEMSFAFLSVLLPNTTKAVKMNKFKVSKNKLILKNVFCVRLSTTERDAKRHQEQYKLATQKPIT
jgi:uncharacterized membrane protein